MDLGERIDADQRLVVDCVVMFVVIVHPKPPRPPVLE